MTVARLKQDGKNYGFPEVTVTDVDGDTIRIGEARYERLGEDEVPVLFVEIRQKEEATSVHLSPTGVAALHAALGVWLEQAGMTGEDD